jgi:3D-(3,5/4)-trihydroxycyclohexane-1,2-dione acylhydrolase (decyclizing)
MAQAVVSFLKNQYVSRDGKENPFFAGAWGIFGHGNVAGLAQALQQNPDFTFHLCRNEQAMVHAAAAFAKMSNRKRAFVCTTSIGPGATNMVTGAATATVNRLPVLLLPGDIFARRNVAPVLQQLESEHTEDISVNDAFKPVSRYWDRINRPDQLPFALLETMRVLTSPANTGAVTLGLPQDVQAEAWDYPEELFRKRVWTIPRPIADRELLDRARSWIREAEKPLIVCGGGVLFSEAVEALGAFVERTGIAVGETQAGKGALPFDHPQNLGPVGVTGTPGANILARECDLVICVGTRLSDFTTASKTAFRNPDVRFININVSEFDAHKHAALPVVADARVTLEELADIDFRVSEGYAARVAKFKQEWEAEVDRLLSLGQGPPVSQGEVIGVVNEHSRPEDVVVCAAGSLPGELHKLWRTRQPNGYHLEYGYSCMGYEIAGGLGAKLADPSREVYVMVGDGSYMMMSAEIVTSVAEGHKLNIIVCDNHGFGSIGSLSNSVGSCGFGTDYRYRNENTGQLDGQTLPIDFAANAVSLGAQAIRVANLEELRKGLEEARKADRTTVVVVEVDKHVGVPGYESWWDVPVSEVSEIESIRKARAEYEEHVGDERIFL